ncbi:HNH endonuclease signature motif containing protein [Loigolactobacillus coryniformis]|uniref:HNH endonuclease signature motif containing protein n=1 Tax=Loigolactobacillus coryniformis TaxID=1610 RepID=UPI00031AA323|nr:HNH endonuclease signature motif containing protein [Loigolactobacillus coryniformis]
MQAFIVMQGRTYQQEKTAGLIWTHKRGTGQVVPPTWARINEIQPQDILFHYVAGQIVAVSQAQSSVHTIKRPAFLLGQAVGAQVNAVRLQYYTLPTPLTISDHLPQIQPLLPQKHAAFQADGSGNQGYIYPCYSALLAQLIDLIEADYFVVKQNEQLSLAMSAVTTTDTDPLVRLLVNADLINRRQMTQTQQTFTLAVKQRQVPQCAICGLEQSTLLEATRLKPLKDSAPAERTTADNGLLLCPSHAALLRQGLIGFSRGGHLLIAPQLGLLDRERLGLRPRLRVSFSPAAAPFLNWHRRFVFQA